MIKLKTTITDGNISSYVFNIEEETRFFRIFLTFLITSLDQIIKSFSPNSQVNPDSLLQYELIELPGLGPTNAHNLYQQ